MRLNQFEFIKDKVCKDLEGLSPLLTYHNIAHTMDVVYQAERIAIAERVNNDDIFLLKIAALYHDTGFLKAYSHHEEASVRIFLHDADQFNLSEKDQRVIAGLIMATKVPQRPVGLLQEIICDADLDYLGRTDFLRISASLRREFLNYGLITVQDEWENLQIRFLHSHQYHTNTSKTEREPVKQQYLATLV
ncbi:MAG TPA: HD domain-containing protein [Chitinophagaceae bacterium]